MLQLQMVAYQCQWIMTAQIFTQAESPSQMYMVLARLFIRHGIPLPPVGWLGFTNTMLNSLILEEPSIDVAQSYCLSYAHLSSFPISLMCLNMMTGSL